jgi:hypothetical protein
MASFAAPQFKTPKQAFDSDDLALLDEAFEASWAEITSHRPLYTPRSEEDLRTNLGRLLLHLAARGIDDVPTLKNLVLVALPLSVVAPARSKSRPARESSEATPAN